jgi:hypothetical protein
MSLRGSQCQLCKMIGTHDMGCSLAPSRIPEVNNMSLLDSATQADWDKASKRQVGGAHYREYAIQPLEFILKNNLGFCEANAVKYICRHAAKGGIQDVDKAIHYLELLKEYKYGQAKEA